MTKLERTAKALLEKLNNMTTEEFSRGGERAERRALHAELVRLGLMEFDADGYRVRPWEKKPMAYDSKSYELAEHFLADEPRASEADKRELAQQIQDAVEDFFFDLERRAEASRLVGGTNGEKRSWTRRVCRDVGRL